MDRELRVIDEQGSESLIEGIRRPAWDGVGVPCPDCGARRVRHFTCEGGRFGVRDGAVERRSGYWDSSRAIFTQCLGCRLVLFKHPAFDLLYDLDGEGNSVIDF